MDSAIALGPLIHEFGWKETDYDLLSSGSLAGLQFWTVFGT